MITAGADTFEALQRDSVYDLVRSVWTASIGLRGARACCGPLSSWDCCLLLRQRPLRRRTSTSPRSRARRLALAAGHAASTSPSALITAMVRSLSCAASPGGVGAFNTVQAGLDAATKRKTPHVGDRVSPTRLATTTRCWPTLRSRMRGLRVGLQRGCPSTSARSG
jgi:hypothetical protein